MAVTFIHTADWQIGKPFGGFDARLAGRLEAARLDAIDRIGEAARERGASFVIVAGDVYDSTDLAERTLRQPLERMRAFADLTWFLIPGNHDYAARNGLWHRLVQSVSLPANVRALVEPRPEPVPGHAAVILPAPLTARALAHDPTAWMDDCATDPGLCRIGLAHGAVHGFGGSGETSVLIDPGRVARAHLEYLALGDWHGTKEVAPRCWYSGTPEPDNFAASQKGFALAVGIDGPGAAAKVTPVATGHFVWARLKARVGSVRDLDAVSREIAEFTDRPQRLLLTLAVQGALPVADYEAFAAWSGDLAARLQHAEIATDELVIEADGDGIAALDVLAGAPELQAVARRLIAIRDGSGGLPAADTVVSELLALRDTAITPEAVASSALVKLIRAARAEAEGSL
ncbi:MAG: DNA repair exonuclease [Hyphomicrobiaceae bacterium]|nr:DNA repair exonuclease [Hyphomicrobiaceae bacterium]